MIWEGPPPNYCISYNERCLTVAIPLYQHKMPAKDRYHDAVKHALIKEGWTIDGEQVAFITLDRQIVIDLQVSKQTQGQIILVEVKGFERSPIEQLAVAIGKLQIYRFVLDDLRKNVPLWLAVPDFAYQGILTEKMGLVLREQNRIDLLVFSPDREEIVEWIPYAKS